MSGTNLLKETLDALKNSGKSPDDVLWVGIPNRTRRPPISFSWNEFAAIAESFNYDAGFGGVEVEGGLRIVGCDWWLERSEYDGSEWWEFKTMPIKPDYAVPCKDDLEEHW